MQKLRPEINGEKTRIHEFTEDSSQEEGVISDNLISPVKTSETNKPETTRKNKKKNKKHKS